MRVGCLYSFAWILDLFPPPGGVGGGGWVVVGTNVWGDQKRCERSYMGHKKDSPCLNLILLTSGDLIPLPYGPEPIRQIKTKVSGKTSHLAGPLLLCHSSQPRDPRNALFVQTMHTHSPFVRQASMKGFRMKCFHRICSSNCVIRISARILLRLWCL